MTKNLLPLTILRTTFEDFNKAKSIILDKDEPMIVEVANGEFKIVIGDGKSLLNQLKLKEIVHPLEYYILKII